MAMRAFVVVSLLAGCSDTTSAPVTWSINVNDTQPAAPGTEAPVVYIDGEARTRLEIEYESHEKAAAASHRIELRHGDAVVRDVSVAFPNLSNCVQAADDDVPAAVSVSFCGYASGDLRYASDSARVEGASCIGDGFCMPACYPDAMGICGTGERCSALVALASPLASRVACVPIGPRQLGDACALIGDAGMQYDDCGAGLLCVGGTCHQLCRAPNDSDCPVCETAAGYAPELRVCP